MSEQSPSTSKTIRFRETRHHPKYDGSWYQIFIEDELWYQDFSSPDWFFWVGLFQQVVGRYDYRVVHEVIE